MAGPHIITKGDTRTPLAAQLTQPDTSGNDAAVDITGLTPKFKMVASDGTTKVALTASNVSIVTAASGLVKYDFQAADVDTAGTYWGWFVIVDGSSETDHYPHDGRTFKIVIHDKEGDT